MIKRLNIFFLALLSMAVSFSAFADDVLMYKVYEEKTGRQTGAFDLTYTAVKEGEKTIRLSENINGKEKTETYLLDENNGVILWHVMSPSEKTDMTVKRAATALVFTGQFKGKKIQEQKAIDSKIFMPNPKIGLQSFIMSDKSEIEFWAVRSDTLNIYELTARKKSVDTVAVNGRSVEAIRIEWGAPGVFNKFFNRIYWFQKSDGQYIKQTGSNGIVKEFVEKKEIPHAL